MNDPLNSCYEDKCETHENEGHTKIKGFTVDGVYFICQIITHF